MSGVEKRNEMADSSVTRSLAETTLGPDTRRAGRAIAPIFVLIIAEAAILFEYIVVGLLIHAMMIFALFGLIAFRSQHRVYEALVFVPLLRLLNLGTGIVSFRPFIWLFGVYTLLLASLVLVMRDHDFGIQQVGLQKPDSWKQWAVIGAASVVGLSLGAVQWAFDLERLPVPPTLQNAILMVLVFGLLVGLVEELLFRGLLQQWVAEATNTRLSIVVVSILFGFMHSIWFNFGDVLFAFSVSLLLGWLYARTKNFWAIWAWHGFINVMAFAILPLVLGPT